MANALQTLRPEQADQTTGLLNVCTAHQPGTWKTARNKLLPKTSTPSGMIIAKDFGGTRLAVESDDVTVVNTMKTAAMASIRHDVQELQEFHLFFFQSFCYV